MIGVPRGIRTTVIAVKGRWGIFCKWATGNGFERDRVTFFIAAQGLTAKRAKSDRDICDLLTEIILVKYRQFGLAVPRTWLRF